MDIRKEEIETKLLDKLKYALYDSNVIRCEQLRDRIIIHYNDGGRFVFLFYMV